MCPRGTPRGHAHDRQLATHSIHLPPLSDKCLPDERPFTIVLELDGDSQHSASEGKVSKLEFKGLSLLKGPPPGSRAAASHTASATSESVEVHHVRVVMEYWDQRI